MQSLSTQEFEAVKHASESYIDIILHPVPQRQLKSIFSGRKLLLFLNSFITIYIHFVKITCEDVKMLSMLT